MSLLFWIVAAVVVIILWVVASAVFGVLVGRAIDLRDRRDRQVR